MSKETHEVSWGKENMGDGVVEDEDRQLGDIEINELDTAENLGLDELGPSSAVSENVLSELDRLILDFESKLWKKTAVKERAISQTLGVAPAVYYQRLIALSRNPEAALYAPVVVRRLKQVYEQRTALRLR